MVDDSLSEMAPPTTDPIVADPEIQQPSSPRPTKRRQSSPSPQSPKRPKIDVLTESNFSTSDTGRRGSTTSKPIIDSERKRGQRLFGGLLSTLAQTPTNNQQKRRQEIEKRQAGRVKQQREEEEKARNERLVRLHEARVKEQAVWGEQSLRIRHSNKLATAQFLETKTEPTLYYRPWKLSAEQEAQIKQQILDTEAQIAEEVTEFKRRNRDRDDELESKSRPEGDVDHSYSERQDHTSSSAATNIDSDKPMTNITDKAQPPVVKVAAPTRTAEEIEADEKDDGEEVIGDEDTVIY